ncbi:MAG: hypothetical protein ABJO27_01885 [Pseudoruegeria sp.]
MTPLTLFTSFVNRNAPLMPGIRKYFGSPSQAIAWGNTCWEELETHVQQHRPPLTLISSEFFFRMENPKRLLNRLRKTFDKITLLAYVRDPLDLYASATDQFIRSGVRFQDLQSPQSFVYAAGTQLRQFASLVDPKDIVVRNFSRSNLMNNDILDDFCNAVSEISGKPLLLQQRPHTKNESLSGAASAWLLTANETFVSTTKADDRHILERRSDVIRRLRDAELLKDYPKLKLTEPSLRAHLAHNAAADCEWINNTFLKGQIPLLTDRPQNTRPAEDSRVAMHDWIFSYLTPEAINDIITSLVPGDASPTA